MPMTITILPTPSQPPVVHPSPMPMKPFCELGRGRDIDRFANELWQTDDSLKAGNSECY